MTCLEILETKITDEKAHAKIARITGVMNTVYEDFSIPLKSHHKKTVTAICQYLESTAQEEKPTHIDNSTFIERQQNTYIGSQSTTNIGTNIERQVINQSPTPAEQVQDIIQRAESAALAGNAVTARETIQQGLQLDPTNHQLLFLRNLSLIGGRNYAALTMEEGMELEWGCWELYQLDPMHPGNTLLYILFRKEFYSIRGMKEPQPSHSQMQNDLERIGTNTPEALQVLANGRTSAKTKRETGLR